MKTSTARRWKIHNPVYGYTLYLVLGGSEEQYHDYIRPRLDSIADGLSSKGSGSFGVCSYRDDLKHVAIWFPKRPSAAVIAHESLHSICHVMQFLGMERMTTENDEAYAYLLDWTVAEIEKRTSR